MSSSLHVNQLKGTAIVPVQANGIHATAFFVAPNKLLTARHFVIDAEMNEGETDVIRFFADEEWHYCYYNEIAPRDIDVVLLTTQMYVQQEECCIKLLATHMIENQQLSIVGYPQEIGNNIDCFLVKVQNYKTLENTSRGFDTMVKRSEDSVFQSYKGFSGSPVLNRRNEAIGIVTDQFTGTLGYLSILSIADDLKRLSIEVSNNEEDADDRIFGLATSRKFVQEALKKAKSRYNEKLHQEDFELTKWLDQATGRNSINPYLEIWDRLVDWYNKYYVFFKGFPRYKKALDELDKKRYKKIESKEVLKLGDPGKSGSNLIDENDTPNWPAIFRLRDIGNRLSEIELTEMYAGRQFYCINGMAGTGKTHLVCHYADEYAKHSHCFLLFGTDFTNTPDAKEQLLEKMEMNEDEIRQMNDLLTSKSRFGLIIIDAVNEGVGERFWADQLSSLMNFFKRYPHLILLLTARNDTHKIILKDKENEWETFEINGFSNVDKAINSFFSNFHIPDRVKMDCGMIGMFSNPLFLYIFCRAYHNMPYRHRLNLTLPLVYNYYLEARNRKVCEIVDEDPYINITIPFLRDLAKVSMDEENFSMISRLRAREIANNLSPLPGWEHNLLHACEIENLLRIAYNTNKLFTAYEFENIGDFLKAIEYKQSFNGKPYTELLADISERLKDSPYNEDLKHVIAVLFSIYPPESKIWEEEEMLNGKYTDSLLDSLQYHRGRDVFESFTSKIIKGIYDKNKERISPRLLKDRTLDIGIEAIEYIHKDLSRMSQNELDAFWTDRVNRLYRKFDGWLGKSFIRDVVDEDRAYCHATVMTWFCASSYPVIRAIAQSAIYNDFCTNPQIILRLIKSFKEVKDPYVIQSLYAAVYGYTLQAVPDDEFILEIAERIYSLYYSDKEEVPQDIIIRFWQMKSMERINYLNHQSEAWTKLKKCKRFTALKNPLYTGKQEIENDNNYFEKQTNKLDALYYSLCDSMSDFSRYTLHMNNTMYSYTYFKTSSQEDVGVSMMEVKRSIMRIIKEDIGWNDELALLDNAHSTSNRFENYKERIGKKYQWIALYKVEAYLSDTCFMRKAFWRKSAVETFNRPWLSPNKPDLDPTLTLKGLGVGVAMSKRFKIEHRYITIKEEDVESWSNEIQTYHKIFTDTKKVEWVPLHLFDIRDTKGGTGVTPQLHQFLYYNTLLCKSDDAKEVAEWAEKQNFCGRWMPEPPSPNDFLWNEYPWSECYESYEKEDDFDGRVKDCPALLSRSYYGQLQEDSMALMNDTSYNSTAYAPSPEIMAVLHLYTAERGIVRERESKEIVSFNILLPESSLSGVLIRKDYLMRYLSESKKVLFCCLCGEKYGVVGNTSINIKSFTGSYLVNADGEICHDNPLHLVIKKKEKTQPIETEEVPFEFIFENLDSFREPIDKGKTYRKQKNRTGKKKSKKKRK